MGAVMGAKYAGGGVPLREKWGHKGYHVGIVVRAQAASNLTLVDYQAADKQRQGMISLQGKNVLLGVSGGIAAYKAAEIVRLLVKAGAVVNVVMTRNATEFITPLTLQTLSGNPVLTDTFDLASGAEIKHVSLADEADIVILAPATANLMAKAAYGMADDLLTTLLLVNRAPVILAPAMNVSMWAHPVVQENLVRLQTTLGYEVVEPVEGLLACGYEGQGKLAEPQSIVEAAARTLQPPEMAGRHVLITAGPTREHIDPVRFLSNPSTGKMGMALARAAVERGAQVTLVLGPTDEPVPAGCGTVVRVETADDMLAACRDVYDTADVLIASAAVADYKPQAKEAHKVKKTSDTRDLHLVRTPDILQTLSQDKGNRILVGFAAETRDLLQHARGKLERKSCDIIVANDVTEPGSGFGTSTNRVLLVTADRVEEVPLLQKIDVARRIVSRVVELLPEKRGLERL